MDLIAEDKKSPANAEDNDRENLFKLLCINCL